MSFFQTAKSLFLSRRVSSLNRKNLQVSALLHHYCNLLADAYASPVFVKVGANDGITGDPFGSTFINDSRWRGLLIEPIPHLCERLRHNYPSTERFEIVQVAIGQRKGEKPFYFVSDDIKSSGLPEARYDYDQLGSFDRGHIERHFNGVLTPYIVAMNVKVEPLSAVLDCSGCQRIHILHIDTEGYDLQVLLTLDLEKYKPDLLLVEHKHLSLFRKLQMKSLLTDAGYVVSNLGSDYCAKSLGLLSWIQWS
jgi:FkbM family methyltransferase